jgi:hypothetical protein
VLARRRRDNQIKPEKIGRDDQCAARHLYKQCRSVSASGQKRRFDRLPITSGLPANSVGMSLVEARVRPVAVAWKNVSVTHVRSK